MSDVRGYSGIAETTDPSALAHLLNEHRAAMNHAILAEDGTVMQFVGDAVMACFGAPVPQDDHADRAFAAAVAMLEAQVELDATWAERGLPPFGLGIGLSTGPVAAALLGSEERLEYTLVGDTVNLAQRLQDLARPGRLSRVQRGDAARRSPRRPSASRSVSSAIKGRAGRRARVSSIKWSASPINGRRSIMTDESPILVTRGLRKNFESEGAPVRALARRRLRR